MAAWILKQKNQGSCTVTINLRMVSTWQWSGANIQSCGRQISGSSLGGEQRAGQEAAETDLMLALPVLAILLHKQKGVHSESTEPRLFSTVGLLQNMFVHFKKNVLMTSIKCGFDTTGHNCIFVQHSPSKVSLCSVRKEKEDINFEGISKGLCILYNMSITPNIQTVHTNSTKRYLSSCSSQKCLS